MNIISQEKLKTLKNKILWDFSLENEFHPDKRRPGYSFVIDVWQGRPTLALYRIRPNYSTTITLEEQPPTELLVKAIINQGNLPIEDGLYAIDDTVRQWLEERLA